MDEFIGLMAVLLIFGGPILILAMIAGTILIVVKISKGDTSKKGRKIEEDEARRVQEIYQGITQMEERIEALETIILEHERKRQI